MQPSSELRVVTAGAGVTWWAEGWRTFTSSIGTWLGIVIVYIILSCVLSMVPFIGSIAEWLLTPVFVGGMMLGCDALHRGESLRIAHLFDGFKGQHFTPLLLIGVCNLVLAVVAAVIALVVMAATVGVSGVTNFGSLAADPSLALEKFGFASLLLIAVALVVAGVIAMANWFAPALIVLRGNAPVTAMVLSLRTCTRNWAPFLVYGAVGIGIAIAVTCLFGAAIVAVGIGTLIALFDGSGNWSTMISSIAFFIALCAVLILVFTPVAFGSTYAGYRDTLAADDSIPTNVTVP